MTTQNEIQLRRDLDNQAIYEKCSVAFLSGFKHFQFGIRDGAILVKKNSNGIYFVKRNGKGNGLDLGKYESLRDCVKSIQGSGWGNNITFK